MVWFIVCFFAVLTFVLVVTALSFNYAEVPTHFVDGRPYVAHSDASLRRLVWLRTRGLHLADQLHNSRPEAACTLRKTLESCVLGDGWEEGGKRAEKGERGRKEGGGKEIGERGGNSENNTRKLGVPPPKSIGNTIDKGRVIHVCVDEEDYMLHVFLHELAHVVTSSVGHTSEFESNLEWIVAEATELGMYTPPPRNARQCGVRIS